AGRPAPLPLFPYTTLFRSETSLEADREENVGRLRLAVGEPLVVRSALELDVLEDDRRHVVAARADGNHAARRGLAQSRGEQTGRSEEHTSELQSRGHLVCR